MRGRVPELGGGVPVEVKVPLHHPFGGAPAGAEQGEVALLGPGRALHAELDERLVEREPVKVAMHVAQHAVDLHDHEQRLGRGGFVILVRRRPRRDAGGFAPGSAFASRDPAGVERGVAERAGRRAVRALRWPGAARHRAARRERRDRGHFC